MAQRNGLKALVLCGFVLGLLTLGSSAAQAEINANWLVAGVGVNTSGLNPAIQVREIENNDGTLLTKISGVPVEFLCTALEITGAKLEKEGKVTNGFRGTYTGCLTKLNGVVSAPCLPTSHTGIKDAIETKELKGLIVLHNGEGLTRIEPSAGTTLALILLGKECAIGTDVPIIGLLTLKDTALKTEAVEHLVVQGPLTEIWAISKTAEHVANLDGSAKVTLSGAAHVGLKWSGLPG